MLLAKISGTVGTKQMLVGPNNDSDSEAQFSGMTPIQVVYLWSGYSLHS